jgi:hypothetical protein
VTATDSRTETSVASRPPRQTNDETAGGQFSIAAN